MDAGTRRIAGWIVAAVGVVVLVVGGFADQIGLGGDGPDDFGAKQIIAVVVGLVLIAAGLVMAMWWAAQGGPKTPTAAE